jgi:hypothetical protein
MNTYWGSGGIVPYILNPGINGGGLSASRHGRFAPAERLRFPRDFHYRKNLKSCVSAHVCLNIYLTNATVEILQSINYFNVLQFFWKKDLSIWALFFWDIVNVTRVDHLKGLEQGAEGGEEGGADYNCTTGPPASPFSRRSAFRFMFYSPVLCSVFLLSH